MTENIIIERAEFPYPYEYLKQIAIMHQTEISQGFISTLGTNFLIKLYSSIIKSHYSFLIIARIENQIIGFLAGSLDTAKVYKHFIFRHGLFILPVLIPRLISVSNILKVIETLLYPHKPEILNLPSAEILNFCVSNAIQRKGVGKDIFSFSMEEFRNFNIREIKIITGASQISAQKFYESIGAAFMTTIEIHKDVKSMIYTFKIAK